MEQSLYLTLFEFASGKIEFCFHLKDISNGTIGSPNNVISANKLWIGGIGRPKKLEQIFYP
jgi:hypothetical protein